MNITGIDAKSVYRHKYRMQQLAFLSKLILIFFRKNLWLAFACFIAQKSWAQPLDNPLLMPRLLPGQSSFVFSLYGSPGEVGELESLISFMKKNGLGGGFDPGPGAGAHSAQLLETIAEANWPVVCYPPDGGRMQVKGGTSVLNPAGEHALRILDRAGQFGAIQLGEWVIISINLLHEKIGGKPFLERITKIKLKIF